MTIVAVEDSWIQISRSDGSVVFTQLLRQGDSYQVPAEEGLALMTGNAGGIAIKTAEKTFTDLGPRGRVRRDIPLSVHGLAALGGQSLVQ